MMSGPSMHTVAAKTTGVESGAPGRFAGEEVRVSFYPPTEK